MDDIHAMIAGLSKSSMRAGCPQCGNWFRLSEFAMFDGRQDLPEAAEEAGQAMQKIIDGMAEDLASKQEKALGSEKRALTVGLGKVTEKILPAHKDFGFVPSECRFLAEPIDMIVFEGLSKGRVDKITFMDVKTGKSTLNTHQRRVRDAIADGRVGYGEF